MEAEVLIRIWEKIEHSIRSVGAWPDYVEAVQALLEHDREKHTKKVRSPIRWAMLPGICCRAAGGDPLWADQVAVAWYLFYFAAHLMDSVVDQDELDASWASLSPSATVNAASGLYFCASKALNQIYIDPYTKHAAHEIVEDFFNSFMVMSSGQHRELTTERPDLEQYWEIAAAKSGSFFTLACRSGARLASGDVRQWDAYGSYGGDLGVLLQMKDDLEDYYMLESGGSIPKLSQFYYSLPFVYAMSVLPDDQRDQFEKLLRSSYQNRAHAKEVLELIEASGFVLYYAAEIERRQHSAKASLELSMGAASSLGILSDIIQGLGKL